MSTSKPPSGQRRHQPSSSTGTSDDTFPEGLCQAGLIGVTLAEYYGVPRDQEVADHEWMLEAAQRGWPVLGGESKHLDQVARC